MPSPSSYQVHGDIDTPGEPLFLASEMPSLPPELEPLMERSGAIFMLGDLGQVDFFLKLNP